MVPRKSAILSPSVWLILVNPINEAEVENGEENEGRKLQSQSCEEDLQQSMIIEWDRKNTSLKKDVRASRL